MSEPYRVPAILNPRKTVWAVDCQACGAQIRMGYGTAAMVHRIVAVAGSLCATCSALKHSQTEEANRG